MQEAGHVPIVLLGSGTTMVGDPSGKQDMRKMLSVEDIDANAAKFKRLFEEYIDFSDSRAILVDNSEWLRNLNYIEFLREFGVHFSINRMLAAECYRDRLDSGLTFFEVNYMIMQAYDFFVLNERYGCTLQLGGNDQWSNIIAGVDLIRRKTSRSAFGVAFALLLNSEGVKMGKTVGGALWLDETKTSPYEFYQYWRNVDDADVERCLALLTFLPMEEVRRLGALEDERINEAKEILAFEITKLIHGEQKALKAQDTSRELFGGAGDSESMPTVEIDAALLDAGLGVIDFLAGAGVVASKSEGRRLIEQGGVTINDERVEGSERIVDKSDFEKGYLVIRKGKKVYYRVILV
jgi:tyrosyl-tRNA synthetase